MKIVFKYTSRSRPIRFFEGLDSIVNNLSNSNDYYIQCTFDLSDSSMNNDEVKKRLHTYKNLVYYFGVSESKIDAINKNLDKLTNDWDILVNFSDDQKFLVHGFDDIIRNDMPDDLDWFLHYPDSHTKDKIPTMSIMGVNYFKRTNRIYHPDFKNVYCDNYAMQEAKVLNRYVFIDKSIFEHYHPIWRLAEWDEQYRKTESTYAEDRQTYLNLMKQNFNQ